MVWLLVFVVGAVCGAWMYRNAGERGVSAHDKEVP
jgi:hypothetical protein